MTDDQVTQAANLLVEARRTGNRISSLPDSCKPSTPEDAYAIQDAVAARLGAVGGWKVGAGSPQAEPACAPMPADLIFRSEQHPSYAASPGTEVETEIAFLLGADLPPRDVPYTVKDVVAAVASVHAAIELVDSRFADRRSVDRLSLLADSLSNGAFVLGSGQKGKRRVDQTTQPAVLYFDDRKVADTVGGNPAGDVYRIFAWLANHVAKHYGGLRAGQIVTTGSCTGMVPVAPSARVLGRLAGIGEVEVAID
ncbi:MAG: fumarylacetoacetate hydrolase family protein [Burkholderiales bacterium]